MPEFRSLSEAIHNGHSTLRALLVGVNEYKHLRSLSCSVADCHNLGGTLERITQEFKRSPLIHVHHDQSERQLTRDAIEQSFNELLGNGSAPQTDILLIYFSGHGVLSKKNNQLYLCLPDTKPDDIEQTALSIQKLLTHLKDSGIKYQVVILDACHSGGVALSPKDLVSKDIGDIPRSISSDEPDDAGSLEDNCASEFENQFKSYQQAVNQETQNFHAFLSCSAQQQSWELPNTGHGAFTYSLIQELSAPSVQDNEGFIRLESLAGHVHDRTEELVYQRLRQRQTPRYMSNSGPSIIIGKINKKADKTAQPESSLGWDNPEAHYKAEYERAIREHYPTIPAEEITRLDNLALQWRLSARQKADIEKNSYERHKEYVDRYQKNVREAIDRSRQQGEGIFLSGEEIDQIRRESRVDGGFISENALRLLDEEIRASYVDGYRQRYRKVLYSYGLSVRDGRRGLSAPLEDKVKLEERREDLRLTPEDATRIANEEKDCFLRDRKNLEKAVVRLIYQDGVVPSQEKMNPHKGELSDRVIEPIIDFQIQQFDQNRQYLRQGIRRLHHQSRQITQEQIQNCQQDIQVRFETDAQICQQAVFSEVIVQSIIEEEEDYLQCNIDTFRNRLYAHTRTIVEPLEDEAIAQFQTDPSLGEDIWNPIVQEVREEHQQQIAEAMRLCLEESIHEN